MPVDSQLRHLVLERLTASDALSHAAMELVAAACMGSDAVQDTLAGNPPPNLLDTEAEAAPRPPHVFLERITAEGFRGIGPRAELALSPGPGLTVVVGRNGTGKSSFAEAAELALTGRNRRWDGRSTVDWRDGLHNLHASGGAQVAIALTVEGHKTPVRVSRSWPPDAQGEAEADVRGAVAATTLESLGWAGPAASYRPFISYSELGQTFDLEPGYPQDRLSGVLGPKALDDAPVLLTGCRRSLDGTVRQAKAAQAGLCATPGALADQRAGDLLRALAEPPDLKALDLTGSGRSEAWAPARPLCNPRASAAAQ